MTTIHGDPVPLATVGDPPDAWVRSVAVTLIKYDIYQGAPHYTTNGGGGVLNFFVNRWFAGGAGDLCNCYDCAGAVWYYAAAAGANPGSVYYTFLNPFGYLREMWLKMRGNVNNPFYGATGGPAVIGRRNAARTAFANHAFMIVHLNGDWRVLDACAGPAYGTDNPQAYIAAATDPEFPNPPSVRNGTVNDVSYPYSSIAFRTNAAAPHPSALTHLAANVQDFANVAGVSLDARSSKDVRPAPWEALATLPGLAADWTLAYEEIVPGYPETVGFRKFTRGEGLVTVELFVASDDAATAHNRFVERGAAHQMPEPIFAPGPEDLGEHSARSSAPNSERYLWVDGNVVYDVSGPADVVDAVVRGVADASAKARAQAAVFPQLRDAAPSHTAAAVGESLSLSLPPSDYLVEVEQSHSGLSVERRGPSDFALHAKRPAEGHVVVVAVDRHTLLASSSSTHVRVR